MLQSIVTRFIGPSNRIESRITAKCSATRVYLKYDPALSPDLNHVRAARKLADRMGWQGRFVGGAMPKGNGCVFVIDTGDSRDSFFAGNNT